MIPKESAGIIIVVAVRSRLNNKRNHLCVLLCSSWFHFFFEKKNKERYWLCIDGKREMEFKFAISFWTLEDTTGTPSKISLAADGVLCLTLVWLYFLKVSVLLFEIFASEILMTDFSTVYFCIQWIIIWEATTFFSHCSHSLSAWSRNFPFLLQLLEVVFLP